MRNPACEAVAHCQKATPCSVSEFVIFKSMLITCHLMGPLVSLKGPLVSIKGPLVFLKGPLVSQLLLSFVILKLNLRVFRQF